MSILPVGRRSWLSGLGRRRRRGGRQDYFGYPAYFHGPERNERSLFHLHDRQQHAIRFRNFLQHEQLHVPANGPNRRGGSQNAARRITARFQSETLSAS